MTSVFFRSFTHRFAQGLGFFVVDDFDTMRKISVDRLRLLAGRLDLVCPPMALMRCGFLRAWHCPVEEACLLGCSMEGLVARSAFHYGPLDGAGAQAAVACQGVFLFA